MNKCIFEIYKSFYYNSDKEYISYKINLKNLERQKRNLKLNALMRDKNCSCEVCNPYTGNEMRK